jgi:hypothetical protein
MPLFFILVWFHTLQCPYSYIHVSMSDLYIPRIGPHIWLQQNTVDRPILEIYFSHIHMSVGIRINSVLGKNKAAQFYFREYINGNQTFIWDSRRSFIGHRKYIIFA